jgi:hypothetical protein
VTRHRTRIEHCQCREVALNLGSHRSENTGWGWCWPRLIDKVLTRHVDPGQMVRQLLTMAATAAVTSLSRRTIEARQPESLTVLLSRFCPPATACARTDRYSVGYSASHVLGTHRGDQVLAGWLCRPRFGPQVTN